MGSLGLPPPSRAVLQKRHAVLDATLLLAVGSAILDLGPCAGFYPGNYMYWFYHAFVFMVPSLLQVWRQQFPWGGTYRPDEIVFSNMLVSVSMASYTLAYSRVPKRERSVRELRPIWQVLATV